MVLSRSDGAQISEPMDLADEVSTVAEVAAILKLNQQTVRNWIEDGALPALRIGRRVGVKRAVLEDILDRGLAVETEPTYSPDRDQSR
jgi:excisionase family DNA binding protein